MGLPNYIEALKCRTLRAMSPCHCGQTLLGGMTKAMATNETQLTTGYNVVKLYELEYRNSILNK